MNILFLTLSQIISDISQRGIYPDLLRKFAGEGHSVFIVCPFERRLKKETCLSKNGNVHTLGVKTLNITKSDIIEKGIGTILIEYQYRKALRKYLSDIQFDLVMYSTPPITFNKVIRSLKKKTGSKSYLLLKDIFPQNAVDMGMLSIHSPLYWFFRKKEKTLYLLSDHIGCMSQANVDYILEHNFFVPKERVEVCPNAIEIQQSDKFTDKKIILSKYGISTKATIFACVGNVGKPQGIDFLIEVLNSNKNRTDAYFLIIGEGTEYNKLNNWLNKVKPNNAKLISNLPKKECDVLIAASDIGLIFLDHRFTVPNYPSRLLTYLENKMPVLMATDTCSDIGKIAEENGYGIWVESNDLEKFDSKLNYLISNKELFMTMGEKGYQYLIDNFTVETSYKIIMSHFK
jgi:glycosyltransferase involved in cell wall biosynthesis